MDFSVARQNMVESQVCPNGVTNADLIEAMLEVEREKFVGPQLASVAYSSDDLQLGNNRFILAPMVFAKLLQLAEIKSDDLVLDIGAGPGYSSAVLARLAQSVIGLEMDTELCEKAGKILVEMDVINAAVICGDHSAGVPDEAPFDVIIVNGRIPKIPGNLTDQLAEGGRLVAIVGRQNCARAMLVTKKSGILSDRVSFDASASILCGFEKDKPGFEF